MFVMIVIVCVSLAWYITEEHPYRKVQVIDVNYEIISRSYVNEAKIETIYDIVNVCFKNNFQKLLRWYQRCCPVKCTGDNIFEFA